MFLFNPKNTMQGKTFNLLCHRQVDSLGQNKNNVIKESHIIVQFQMNWQDGSLHEQAPQLDKTQEQLDSVENHHFMKILLSDDASLATAIILTWVNTMVMDMTRK